jgi:hypothetical protein
MLYTAKTLYRKFKTNIPRKGIAQPQSHFHIHVSVIAHRHIKLTQFLFWEHINGIFVAVYILSKIKIKRQSMYNRLLAEIAKLTAI